MTQNLPIASKTKRPLNKMKKNFRLKSNQLTSSQARMKLIVTQALILISKRLSFRIRCLTHGILNQKVRNSKRKNKSL